MKTKLATVMLSIMLLSFAGEFLLSVVPAFSSMGFTAPSIVSALGSTIPANVGATQNFEKSINITGNILVNGSDIVRFSGASPSKRAKVFLDGNITVQGNGTLVLEYVVLYLMGARSNYNRRISLFDPSSSNHPSMVVRNATIVAYSTDRLGVSYGSVIDIRDNSRVTGNELAFYRQNASRAAPASARLAGTILNCSGESYVYLSYVSVDAMRMHHNANVTIYMGGGPRRAPGTAIARYDLGTILEVNDFSRANLYGVNFTASTVSGNAYANLKWCKVPYVYSFSMKVKNAARVDFSRGCYLNTIITGGAALDLANNASVTFDSSTLEGFATTLKVVEAVLARDDATFVASNSTLKGLVNAKERSVVSFINISKPSLLNGAELELHNSSKVYLRNCLFWSGTTISVYDSSHFSAVSVTVNYGVIRFFDKSSGSFSASAIKTSHTNAYDEARVEFTNGCRVENALGVKDTASLYAQSSSIPFLFNDNMAQVTLTNSTVSMMQVKDVSRLVAVNSTIKELQFVATNVSGFWTDLTDYFANANLNLTGMSPQIALNNTYVDVLDVLFLGHSNVTISNSTLGAVAAQGSSAVTLKNVTFALNSVSIEGDAILHVWSVLRVRTVDYFGNPISGADITIRRGVGPYNPKTATGTSDNNGWASFLVFSGLFNATGQFLVGNFEVESSFARTSEGVTTYMTGDNKDVTLSLPLPFWTNYIFTGIVVVVLIAIYIVGTSLYKRRRNK